eukprot:s724_g11.t2
MAGEGDVMMSPDQDQAEQLAQKSDQESPQDTAKEPATAESPTETKEPKGPTNEERVVMAESAKEAGNALLKAGDAAAAVSKYAEGIELTEPLLEKDPGEVGEELQKRGTAVYLALRLNSAQANIKQSSWLLAIEHASKVLLIEKDNTKALYRRSLAGLQLDTEGRLEEARGDLSRLIQLEPSNREAREMLFKVKERLKDEELRQQEKERLSAAMKGGLYQEQHKKLGKLQAAYEEEVKRLKDAGEDEISFEDFAKKTKEKEEELEKKQKEEAQKRREEERQKEEERQLEEENQRRASEGKPSVTMEDWRAEAKAAAAQEKKRVEEVVKMDEAELDEEDKKLLKETKEKGYYHGRLGTVLSDAAPKPQLVTENKDESSPKVGSEWNQAGTWEEKDASSWAQERLTAWLGDACVSGSNVTLPAGAGEVTAKVSKVKSVKGEAHIVYVRKQPRHGFSYEAELSFSMNLGDDKFSGTLSLPEIMDAIACAELRVDARWKGSGPSQAFLSLANEWLDRLRERVRGQVAAFKEEYQKRS